MSPHGPLGTQPVLIKPCSSSPAFWLHLAPIPALQPAGLLKDICHSLGAVQKPFRIPSGPPCKTQIPDANSRPILHHPPCASAAQTPMRLPRPLHCSDVHVDVYFCFLYLSRPLKSFLHPSSHSCRFLHTMRTCSLFVPGGGFLFFNL